MGRITYLNCEPVRAVTLDDLEPFEEITEWSETWEPPDQDEEGDSWQPVLYSVSMATVTTRSNATMAAKKPAAKKPMKKKTDPKWMEKAAEKMKEKGTKGSFGKATPKKIEKAEAKGGKMAKKAAFAKVAMKVAKKKKAKK